ncbi:2-phosphosulfolactate phosphatase [Tengunoibacter tsumagoiensis]|uniref:Probable 2-phosphosulfolactate phosphatase n=1 Tax=Tengunoibacter tsumagoiensis TaxID=2014871 RepID=A0A402A242_9CHLR|nr:2-phosphosulfolactate phosphatase [Tengunoibacter tsumagoiensis]GCE13228.1 putative 2-phosphosulfolactate phosphatase [Tengunoibacter tsumagoiensis]
MQIVTIDRHNAAHARGIVIVIDVIRAFSVAGYAFAEEAHSLWLVRSAEEARALQQLAPDALLGGEIGGRLIPGFDFNNSPSQMAARDVRGKRLIQRTGAGTQGAVNASDGASIILLCALTNAQATAEYARQRSIKTGEVITILPTAHSAEDPTCFEDEACAQYIEALLHQDKQAQTLLETAIHQLQTAGRFDAWKQGYPDLPFADIEAVLQINRFPFAMIGTRKEWQGITYVEVHQYKLA